MRVVNALGAACVALAIATPAAAHLDLKSPTSRYGRNALKIGPCGLPGGDRSDNITELEAGASLEVVWDEYINHPGHFRISFDANGDDDFVNPKCLGRCNTTSPQIETYSNPSVLLDAIADTASGGIGRATVQLPDIECDRCTLQVIQVMYDKPPFTLPGDDIYYQCADLVLRRRAAPTASETPSPEPTPTATATAQPTPTDTPPPPTATPSPATTASPTPVCGTADTPPCAPACFADCDGSGAVDVTELITLVNIALDVTSLDACRAADPAGDGTVDIADILRAVQVSLNGCE